MCREWQLLSDSPRAWTQAGSCGGHWSRSRHILAHSRCGENCGPLSIQNPQFEYDIYRVESSNDAIKGVVARYGNGSQK